MQFYWPIRCIKKENLIRLFIKQKKYPAYTQLDHMDCGPTCLKNVLEHFGKKIEINDIRKKSSITLNGVSFLGLAEAAEKYQLKTIPAKLRLEQLTDQVPLPAILHWEDKHFVVLFEVNQTHAVIADPRFGLKRLTIEEIANNWIKNPNELEPKGAVLLIEPMDTFNPTNEINERETYITSFFDYLKPYKKNVIVLLIGLLAVSLINLSFPILTQSIVDFGINYGDVKFIYVVLVAQLVLFLSSLAFEVVRGWIVLHISGKLSVKMLSDFLIHLLNVKLNYFQSKHIGDITTRINDNFRIQNFLSSTSLSALFGLINVVVFGVVLLYYNVVIFLIFIFGSLLYVLWILSFMKKKKQYDIDEFIHRSKLQKYLIQLVTGIEDIKLNGSERKRRWEWEAAQGKLYGLSIKNLSLFQKQQYGAKAINELKNIIITFYAATAVVSGEITLGVMIAIQYILGQLNVPFNILVNLTREYQEAKLSLERLYEIKTFDKELSIEDDVQVNANSNIVINGLTFRYGPIGTRAILDDVSMLFEKEKTTAIVGHSGSGKTTIIKLLLKFYDTYEGKLEIGGVDLKKTSTRDFRKKCGVVMQNGQLFNDSVVSNVCESDNGEEPNLEKFNEVINVTNLKHFISDLPKGKNTILGTHGNAVSGGEKQRLLLARALYKNPQILILDEATSALDAGNESKIIENLKNKVKCTVIVIAHRLSTVEDADKIYVMDKGKVIEQGNHTSLVRQKGEYYRLIKNQLNLG